MRKKIVALIMGFLSLGAILATTVASQDYPTKPLEIICPYAPGGSIDIGARQIANVGPKHFGQPMVVVNKPGSAGSHGVAEVLSSKPDGYKAIYAGSAYFATTVKTQKLPFDPNDLIPLANFVELKQCMVVKGDSPFKTLDDLLAYGRKNPGQLKWGHPGRGIVLHLVGLSVFRNAGVNTIDVPFKGDALSLPALLGGHIDAGSVLYGSVSGQLKAGIVRLLMVYSDKRYKDQPNVPTMVELGHSNALMFTFFGLYVRKDTPETIRKKLTDVCKKIYEDPEYKEAMEKQGEELRWGGTEFIKETIKKQEEIGIPLLKELGLYIGK